MDQGGDDCSINICGLAPNVGIVNVAPPPFGREFMVVERSIGMERKNSGIRGEGCALLRNPGGSRGGGSPPTWQSRIPPLLLEKVKAGGKGTWKDGP